MASVLEHSLGLPRETIPPARVQRNASDTPATSAWPTMTSPSALIPAALASREGSIHSASPVEVQRTIFAFDKYPRLPTIIELSSLTAKALPFQSPDHPLGAASLTIPDADVQRNGCS